MTFKAYWLGLPVAERESLAQQAGTTRAQLHQVAYVGRPIELGLADCLVALCAGITLSDLPLTERAKSQNRVRMQATQAELADTAKAGA